MNACDKEYWEHRALQLANSHRAVSYSNNSGEVPKNLRDSFVKHNISLFIERHACFDIHERDKHKEPHHNAELKEVMNLATSASIYVMNKKQLLEFVAELVS